MTSQEPPATPGPPTPGPPTPPRARRARVLVLAWVLPVVVGSGLVFISQRGLNAVRLRPNTGPAPWALPDHLAQRIRAVDLPPYKDLSGDRPHPHAHLDIFVDGRPVTVPAELGLAPPYAALHTHANSGIIHMESSKTDAQYDLGQFFGLWGVRFTNECLGSYCSSVRVYVNGDEQPGKVTDVVLEPYSEIAVVAGAAPSDIPSSYDCHNAGAVERVSCRGFLTAAP